MAARTRQIKLTDGWKEKIRCTQLIHRLQDFANGKPGVKMSGDQVRAAIALLKKVAPDLQAVSHTGDDGGPLTVNIIKYSELDVADKD